MLGQRCCETKDEILGDNLGLQCSGEYALQLRGLGAGINDREGQAEFGCQVPEEIGRVFLRGDIAFE